MGIYYITLKKLKVIKQKKAIQNENLCIRSFFYL